MQPRIDIDGRELKLDVRVVPRAGAAAGGIDADVDLGLVLALVREAIVRRLPHDPCRRHGADNFVARLRRYRAWVDGELLWFEVELRVQAWACVEFRHNELRHPLADGDLRLRLPLRARAVAGTLNLRVGRPEIGVRGPLGEAARWYFGLRGEELGAALARRAERLNARGLVLSRNLAGIANSRLDAARFIDAGRPSLRLQLALAPTLPDWFGRFWPWGKAPEVPAP